MTRGRDSNTAHLVAESIDDARQQWVDVFGRDRADLGAAHARRLAVDAIERYGTAVVPPTRQVSPLPEYRAPVTRRDGIGL